MKKTEVVTEVVVDSWTASKIAKSKKPKKRFVVTYNDGTIRDVFAHKMCAYNSGITFDIYKGDGECEEIMIVSGANVFSVEDVEATEKSRLCDGCGKDRMEGQDEKA